MLSLELTLPRSHNLDPERSFNIAPAIGFIIRSNKHGRHSFAGRYRDSPGERRNHRTCIFRDAELRSFILERIMQRMNKRPACRRFVLLKLRIETPEITVPEPHGQSRRTTANTGTETAFKKLNSGTGTNRPGAATMRRRPGCAMHK